MSGIKNVIIYLLTLSTCFLAHANDTKSKETVKAYAIAEAILDLYQLYKDDNRAKCTSLMKESFNLEITKDVMHQVPENCTVDSLVFRNDESEIYGYFKTVDIEYLKVLEGTIAFKNDKSTLIAERIMQVFLENEQTIYGDSYSFTVTSPVPIYVIDDRFKKETKSILKTRYQFDIQVVEDYLLLDFKETVPRRWSPIVEEESAQVVAKK